MSATATRFVKERISGAAPSLPARRAAPPAAGETGAFSRARPGRPRPREKSPKARPIRRSRGVRG